MLYANASFCTKLIKTPNLKCIVLLYVSQTNTYFPDTCHMYWCNNKCVFLQITKILFHYIFKAWFAISVYFSLLDKHNRRLNKFCIYRMPSIIVCCKNLHHESYHIQKINLWLKKECDISPNITDNKLSSLVYYVTTNALDRYKPMLHSNLYDNHSLMICHSCWTFFMWGNT